MCFRDKSYLRYKLGRFFEMVDVDKDGKFDRKDFTDWVNKSMENMAAIGHEVTDERRKKIERLSTPVYNLFTFYGLMGKNKKRWVGFVSVATQMPGFKMIAKLSIKKLLKLFDFDDSGDWSLDEYVQILLLPIGISEEDTNESSKLLDTDGKGVLDIDEVVEGLARYLSDLEENKWAHMLGRIDYDPDTRKE